MLALLPYLKGLLYALGLLVGIIALYGLSAIVLALFTVNSGFQESEEGVTIYLISNGAHVDICTPVHCHEFDWGKYISLDDFESGNHKLVSVGWGDRGFYLETPTWGELKFSVAFKALFMHSETAMHITLLDQVPEPSEKVIPITISSEQYRMLVDNIKAKFHCPNNGPEIIRAPHDFYPHSNDNFYEAHGSYWYYETCNVWTNRVLNRAGIKSTVWAPFSWCLMRHYR